MDIDTAKFGFGGSFLIQITAAGMVAVTAALAHKPGTDGIVRSTGLVVGGYGGTATDGYVAPGRVASTHSSRSKGSGAGPNAFLVVIVIVSRRRRKGTVAEIVLLARNESQSPNGRPGNGLVHHLASIAGMGFSVGEHRVGK